MNPEGLVTKKTSGKDKLDPKDMSTRSGMDEGYVRKAMKHGFLNPPHYTSKWAADGVELSSQDKERVEKHIESMKAKRGPGFTSEKAMRELATSKVVEAARIEGRPVHFKYREKSAEEVFDQFWKSPAGKKRMTGKLKKEIDNIDAGGYWYEGPRGLHIMPQDYDSVLWETTKQEAARLRVLADIGDKEAAEKYRILQNKWSDQLPPLDTKPEIKEKMNERR